MSTHRSMSAQLKLAAGTNSTRAHIRPSRESKLAPPVVESSFQSPAPSASAATQKPSKTSADAESESASRELEQASKDMLVRLYAKFDATNEALAAMTPGANQQQRPSSPGLSPIQITANWQSPGSSDEKSHSPKAKLLRFPESSNDCAHYAGCDHSIHSIRPATFRARKAATGNSFAEEAAMELQAAVPVAETTKPADLYHHAEERQMFFKLIQQLWEQQCEMYEHQQQQRKQAEKKHQPQSRSTMTTLTSTPTSIHSTSSTSSPSGSSVVSANSTPEQDSSAANKKSDRSANAKHPLAVWEKQVTAWENRLCAWKNSQESMLQLRARELEGARLEMEQAMKQQEELYKTRTARFQVAAEKLERDRKEWKDEVSRNSQREAQLQALLHERERELARKEARLAKQKREFEESLIKAVKDVAQTRAEAAAAAPPATAARTASSVNTMEQTLHALTLSLTQAFEEKEKTLSDLYTTKMRKVAEEAAEARRKEKEWKRREEQWVQEKLRMNQEMEKQQANPTASEQLDSLQTELDNQKLSHLQDLRSLEAKWARRQEGWEEERKKLQEKVHSLEASAMKEQEEEIEHGQQIATLQKQVDKLHSRLRGSEEKLAAARARVEQCEEEVEGKKDLEVRYALAESKIKQLESHLVEMRQELSGMTLSGQEARAVKLQAEFEGEIKQQKEAYEQEIKEMQQSHQEQAKEYEQCLASSKTELESTNATILAQSQLIQEFRAAMEEQHELWRRKQEALEAAMTSAKQKPAMEDSGTDCSELIAVQDSELALLRESCATKDHLIARLRAECVEAEKLLSQMEEQGEKIKEAWMEHQERILLEKTVEHGEEISQLKKTFEEEHAAIVRSYEAILEKERLVANEKESSFLSHSSEVQLKLQQLEERERIVRQQIDLIEKNEVQRLDGLREKESDLSNRARELKHREEQLALVVARFEQEKSLAETAWMKRQLQYEQEVTRQQLAAKELQERDADRQRREEEQQALYTRFESDQAAFQQSFARFQSDLQSYHEQLSKLQLDQSVLASDRATLQDQAEELRSVKAEVEDWKLHVQKRDQELTDAIAKFESHMHSRESSCTEWESRLRVVESKYSDEFTKMNDELTRLNLWESELLTFQSSLQARERHLNLVERNLSEYLAPFNDSIANGSGILDTSVASGASPHPRVNLTDEQRKVLATLATPIMNRKYQSRMSVTPSHPSPEQERDVLHSVPVPSTLAASLSTLPSPSSLPDSSLNYASSSPISIYSPTQAELSMIDDEHETIPTRYQS